MPIEFDCPHCGQRMRTPDNSAGKKGKCPSCGGVAKIPAESSPPGSGPAGSGPAAGSPTAGSSAGAASPGGTSGAAGVIEFACLQCSKLVRVPSAHAGKKGKCPHCQAIVQIPQSSPASPGSSPAKATSPRPSTASSGAPSKGITFDCPGCRKQVKTPASAAGKKGKCPHCGVVMQIPTRSTTPAAGQQKGLVQTSADELTPLPGPGLSAGLTPLDGSGGLTPLGPPGDGLAPLGGNAGLTPLGGNAGLTPLGGDAGLTPLGAGGGLQPLGAADPFGTGGGGLDPFSDLQPAGAGDPLADPYAGWSAPAAGAAAFPSGGYAAPNPYAAPSASATKKRKSSGGGGRRSGLPWDRAEEGGLFATIKLVLSDPSGAFSRMSRNDGLGRPLGFAVLGCLIAMLIALSIQIALNGILIVAGVSMGNMGQDQEAATLAVYAFQSISQLGMGLVAATVGTVIHTFVYAAILHVMLLILGGAEQEYETSYRVVAYALGSTSFFSVIPICGSVIYVFAYPVYLIIGLSHAHETDAWRAACAVLLPYLLCCVATIGTVVMVIGAIAAAQ